MYLLYSLFQYSDQLANIQKDLQASVQDVDKNKKLYFDEEHCAHDVRDKARDIEEKFQNDPNDPNGPDIDTKIEELKQAIRRSETGKVKAEARLECLKVGDVNVDEWLADMEPMEMESLTVQEQDMQRSASSLSMRTDGDTHGSDSMYDSDYADGTSEHANVGSMEKHGSEEEQETASAGTGERNRPDSTEIDGEWAMLEQRTKRIEQLTAGWDDPTQVSWGPEDGEEPAPVVPPEPTGPVYKCIALYSYTGSKSDELSIVENEQLEVIGDGDGDGWLRARNYKGEEGFVPHNYLDVDREENVAMDNSLHTGASSYQLTSQISFSSVDYTVDENEEPNSEVSVTTITTVKESIPAPVKNLDLTEGSKDVFAIALYDYEATCPEELNLSEGQVLKILRKIVHDDVDDGWWEGQLGDEIGLFPSLVVEECRENGEPLTPDDDETPPPSAPPVFTPPDAPPFLLAPQQVTITHTQPTPVGDRDPNADSGFAVTISKNQKQQYETQFSEDEDMADDEPASEEVPSIGK
ncbi:hypothetical protein WDU94_001049 [Cyamophila willieti]